MNNDKKNPNQTQNPNQPGQKMNQGGGMKNDKNTADKNTADKDFSKDKQVQRSGGINPESGTDDSDQELGTSHDSKRVDNDKPAKR